MDTEFSQFFETEKAEPPFWEAAADAATPVSDDFADILVQTWQPVAPGEIVSLSPVLDSPQADATYSDDTLFSGLSANSEYYNLGSVFGAPLSFGSVTFDQFPGNLGAMLNPFSSLLLLEESDLDIRRASTDITGVAVTNAHTESLYKTVIETRWDMVDQAKEQSILLSLKKTTEITVPQDSTPLQEDVTPPISNPPDPGTTPDPGDDDEDPGTTPDPGDDDEDPGTTPDPGDDDEDPGTTPDPGDDDGDPGTTPDPGDDEDPGTTPDPGDDDEDPGTTPDPGDDVDTPPADPDPDDDDAQEPAYPYDINGTAGDDTLVSGVALNVANITTQNGLQPWSYMSAGDLMRFEVHSGDRWEKDGTLPKERSEIAVLDTFDYQETYLVSVNLMVEAGQANTADWLTLFQIQSNFDDGEPGHSPALEIGLIGEKMVIITRYDTNAITADNNDQSLHKTTQYIDSDDITRGQWYDLDIIVNLDAFGNGSLQIYRDNILLVDYEGAIGFNDVLGHSWKQGIYREASDESMAAYYQGLTITKIDNEGTSFYGDDGVDKIFGGAGDDIIHGGAGEDYLYGGAGADTFVFDLMTAFTGVDTVLDFNAAEGDSIDISNLLIGFDPTQSSIDDYLIFGINGNEILVSVDRDGWGADYAPEMIAILQTPNNMDVPPTDPT